MALSMETISAMKEIKKTIDRLSRQVRYLSHEERGEVGMMLGKIILRALGNLPPSEHAPEHVDGVAPWHHPSEGRRPDIALDDTDGS